MDLKEPPVIALPLIIAKFLRFPALLLKMNFFLSFSPLSSRGLSELSFRHLGTIRGLHVSLNVINNSKTAVIIVISINDRQISFPD